VAKSLHWATVGLVVFQFTVGVGELDVFGDFEDVHGSAGVALLAVTILRLLWRQAVALPPWPSHLSRAERRLIHLVEMTLYAMLFAKPITGLFLLGADGDEFELFGQVEVPPLWPESDESEEFFDAAHFVTGLVLLAAIVCHVALVVGRRLLPRMVPFLQAQPEPPVKRTEPG
jgi:cytochrome b561